MNKTDCVYYDTVRYIIDIPVCFKSSRDNIDDASQFDCENCKQYVSIAKIEEVSK